MRSSTRDEDVGLPPRGGRLGARARRWQGRLPLLFLIVAAIVLAPASTVSGRVLTAGGASATAMSDGSPVPPDGATDLGYAFTSMFPGAGLVGPASPSTPIDVGVALPVRNGALLNETVQQVSTPGSPSFRHFLTPGEFDAQFAPTLSAYDTAVGYFQSFGARTTVTSDRLMITVQGTPQSIGAAFHTSFATYRLADGTTYYGPSSTPWVPASLGLSGAFGFTDARDLHPDSELAPATPEAAAGPALPLSSTCTNGTGSTSKPYTPCQIENVYGTRALLVAGDTGAGEQIAVVDAYDPTETQTDLSSDFSHFVANYNLPTVPVNYLYPVALPSNCNSTTGACEPNDGWGGETVLDMDWSHAEGTGATLDVTLSPDSGDSLYFDVNALVAEDVPNVISLSWGEPSVNVLSGSGCTIGCNASTDGSYVMLHPVIEAAAAEGISVFVASGDCGADDGTPEPAADYPAADEDATGVGGTVVTPTGWDYNTESTTGSGWSGNESSCPDNSGAAGGGWAPTPQPWWQHGYGVPTKHLRGVPDVGITVGSWLAVYQGGDTYSAGTSDGAPQWAGLTAIADQINGGDVGLINPVLYSILRSSNYNSTFHDITTGNGNGYAPHAGWNPIVGVGTPYANVAIPVIAAGGYHPSLGTLAVTLSANAVSGTAPLKVTFTATASGGTGSYSLYDFSTGVGPGNASMVRTNTASWTYTTKGAFVASVEVFDSSGNSSTSLPIVINVGNTVGSLAVTLGASTTSPAIGSTVTFTVSASGGSTPYAYGYYPGDGSYFNDTTGTSLTHAYESCGTFQAVAIVFDGASPPAAAESNVLTLTVVGGACGLTAGTLTLNRSSTGETSYSVTFTAPFSGGSGYSGTWCWGDGQQTPFSGLASSPAVASHTYTTSGTFVMTVFINDSQSASVSESQTLTVHPLLQLEPVVPSKWHSLTPANVTFSAIAAVGGTGSGSLSSYSWTYGNGNSASTAAGVAFELYTAGGTYTVSVTATDSLGYQAGASVTLSVFGSAASLHLSSSWNLVALPSGSNDYTLFELAQLIGGPFSSIEDMTSGTVFTAGAGTGNTAVNAGDALWIDVTGPKTLTLYGNSSTPTITYTSGSWTWVGWSAAASSSLLGIANLAGGGDVVVSLWNATSQTWVTYLGGFDGATSWLATLGVVAGQALVVYAASSGSFGE